MNGLYEDLRFVKDILEYNLRDRTIKRKELQKFRNIHNGKRCFIVGTGPSLKLEDVEILKYEYTFGVNSCFKIFDKTTWRPTYYVVTDPKFISDMGKELDKCSEEITCGFCGDKTEWHGSNIHPITTSQIYMNVPRRGFIKRILEKTKYDFMTKDLSQGIINGHTVVFSAIQIAEYMGFSEIYLLGIDCNYKGKLQYSELTSHTHINNPNAADLMVIDYLYAKRHCEKTGKLHIYNATRGGMLEVFERVHLEDIIKDGRSHFV